MNDIYKIILIYTIYLYDEFYNRLQCKEAYLLHFLGSITRFIPINMKGDLKFLVASLNLSKRRSALYDWLICLHLHTYIGGPVDTSSYRVPISTLSLCMWKSQFSRSIVFLFSLRTFFCKELSTRIVLFLLKYIKFQGLINKWSLSTLRNSGLKGFPP